MFHTVFFYNSLFVSYIFFHIIWSLGSCFFFVYHFTDFKAIQSHVKTVAVSGNVYTIKTISQQYYKPGNIIFIKPTLHRENKHRLVAPTH